MVGHSDRKQFFVMGGAIGWKGKGNGKEKGLVMGLVSLEVC